MTDVLVEDGTFDKFRVSRRENGLVILHLQLADDTMFFLGATRENVVVLKNLLLWFELYQDQGIISTNQNLQRGGIWGVGRIIWV